MSAYPPRGSEHPALAAHLEERSRDVQNRVADTITRFAGSMLLVYVHVVGSGSGSGSASRTFLTGS